MSNVFPARYNLDFKTFGHDSHPQFRKSNSRCPYLKPLLVTFLTARSLSHQSHQTGGRGQPGNLHGAQYFVRSLQLLSYSRVSQPFMDPDGSLLCSQEPFTGPYPKPDESSPYYPILSFQNQFGAREFSTKKNQKKHAFTPSKNKTNFTSPVTFPCHILF
jgi:hypothetical protein